MQDNPAKSKPSYKPRVCEDCGVRFTPLSGRGTRCPLCRKLHRREQKQQYNSDYYDAHQDELVAYAAQYRAEHPEEHRAASLRWEQANPDRKRDNDAAYRERNRLRIRTQWKAAGYPRNTPAQYASNARRRQRLVVGMTSEDRRLSALFRLISVDFPCFYCGMPAPADGPHELEHYFPLSQGGTDVWQNILRACRECNRGPDGKHDMCGTAFMLWRGDWKPFLPLEPALSGQPPNRPALPWRAPNPPPRRRFTMPDTPASKPEPKSRSGLWTALANLSIGRAGGDKADKQADIVHKGETVTLTDDQAQGFLHRHRRPVIRPAADQNQPATALTAKDLFGQRPPAEAFGARPDPPGSSKVTVNDEVADPADPRNAPEAKDPKTDFSVDPAAAKDKSTGVKAK